MNNTMKRLLALCACVVLLVTMVAACGKKDNTSSELKGCTITIQAEGGNKLANVGVSVYADTNKTDLLDFVRTNDKGVATLTATVTSGSAYIFLTDVPEGYTAKEYYTITEQNTVISLAAQMSTEMSKIELGKVMFDFTVTDQNGTEYTLSKLLESKKAVVLNLWYTTCVPCKMEFPYLQQVYNEYRNDIALLALNPIDNADAIATFAAENNLTMPMAACDPGFADQIDGIAYPTTIVVDRFGMVSLIHTGSIDNSKTFKNLFAHFAAEDYEAATFTSIDPFLAVIDKNTLGTAENPYEYSGNTGFSVDVEPNQTVYYSLYGVDGLNLSVSSDSLKLVCGEQEYTPANGKIEFTIRATDATAPVLMNFTNTGAEKATYKVVLTSPAGSAANPITMKDGAVTVKMEEGNKTGVYYQYKASGNGTFTLECKNTVNYTVSIKNLNGKETATLDSKTKKATIDVRKNDKVQVIVTAVAKDGKYPATEAKLNASFQKTAIPTGGSSGGSSTALNTNGKLVNADKPDEFSGAAALNFDTEAIKPGEIRLFHLYRVTGTILCISDASAYVIYEGKTYTPDKNGNIAIPVSSSSPTVPVAVQIGNGGKSNKKYTVKCVFPEGSLMNPYDAKAGTIKTNIAAGNDQGVYYQCTAEQDGIMTITLKKVTSGVDCDIKVDTFDASLVPYTSSLSLDSEDGKTFTVDIAAGDTIRISVVALPDEDTHKYPAATIEFTVSFS